MQHANVKLSKNEWLLVTDKDVILTKNLVIQKVYTLFGMLSSNFQEITLQKKALLPPEALSISPKISKGENYLGLPYVVLDYPRFYTRQCVLAIRCFFWWGNFFSITLHLGGRVLAEHKDAVFYWMKANCNNGWYINSSADAWQHHFESDNYRLLDNVAAENFLLTPPGGENDFIKLAKKIPLQEWDGAFDFFTEGFSGLLALMEN